MGKTTMLPLIVNRGGKKHVIQVRRESDTEIMQNSILKTGKIVLRVAIQIKGRAGQFYGYQGSGSFRECPSIKAAREFEKALRRFVEGGSK